MIHLVLSILCLLFFVQTTRAQTKTQNADSKGQVVQIRKKGTTRKGTKRIPTFFVHDIVATVFDGNLLLRFTNETYRNVLVSIDYEGMLLYSTFLDNPYQEDIEVNIPSFPTDGEYTLTIETDDSILEGRFTML